MIVRRGPGVLHLVTQPDHAALAARIMAVWPPLEDAPRRGDILAAIEQHDRGWREADAAPTVDVATGTVLDFVHVPASVRQGVWSVSVGLLASMPWAAALVAHHAVTVYDRFRPAPEWHGFFDTMTALRREHLGRAGGDLPALAQDYVFLRLGDLLSLAFCTATDATAEFNGWAVRLEGTRVHVTPNLFRTAVRLDVAAREIPDVPYATNDALAAAIAAGVPRTLEGAIAPSGRA
ncbi:MAG: DUF3891 family protein [Vicinamibacterales bacterium]